MFHGECDGECLPPLQGPLPHHIDELSIYSRDDGVVDWRTCLRNDATSLEVRGTHVGLICNPAVYRALAQLLAERPRSAAGEEGGFPCDQPGLARLAA
jgi:hypothetical protein